MVTPKLPLALDTSRYETIENWSAINPRPVFVYTKATEGTGYKDPKFEEYMAGILSIGAVRGIYHFNRKAYNPTDQAKWFIKCGTPVIDHKTWLILDVEENETPASSMVLWFEWVMGQLPNNPVALYGRAEQLNKISMTSAQKAFMKTIPLIVAGYPTYPDNFSTIPPAYVPDQTKYGKPILWQYSEKGIIEGVDGEVDLNMVIDETILGGTTPPEEEPMTVLYKADLKAGAESNVRSGAGTGYNPPIGVLTGPVTVDIVSEKTVAGGYDWYQISAPLSGWIALTTSYENFRAVTAPPANDNHVKVTVERTGYKPLILEGDMELE